MPAESVIIPHYNDTRRLRRCLAALLAGDTAGAEILVVDNGSTEPLDALKAEFATVRFIEEPKPSAASARNCGVRESRGGRLCFIDADCVPAPDWLAAARRTTGDADIVGGAIDVFDETPGPRSGAEAFETVFAFNYRDYIERKGFFVTANLVTSRVVMEAVGPFTPGVSEDLEWCLRASDMGFRLALDENLRVAHPTRADWPALERKWLRIAREMFVMHSAAHPGAAGRFVWFLWALVMPASIALHLPKILLSPKLRGAGERLRGAGTLVRLRFLRSWWMLRQALGASV
ncbi:glycosyltransferase [Defluviimonas sp. D31]|uniref:glycosyltransferase n=1 Tax=Defluviimonas sp. D31 TaxID=3083253 RepID=UPI00296EE434|nr:glycosyltransferase [Defluviimonas sp. D31]MDW4550095.1 glycosyltransferase [Defluviimonas sp. D31]